MCYKENINEITSSLIGIISSNYRGKGIKPYKNYAHNYFSQGGGMVYVFSKYKENDTIDYLTKLWELDIDHLCNNGQIIFIPREDFFDKKRIDDKEFLQILVKGLSQLNVEESKKKCVYLTVDSFWVDFFKEDFEKIYNNLLKLCGSGKINTILRYIIEELQGECINNILSNHEYLFVDGVEDYKVYTPNNLVYESINIMSKYDIMKKKYEKEMMRIEHLKTLGELMEGTIHDINNLLITILGYVQLSMNVKDLEEIEDYLRIIYRTAMNGKTIADRFKHYIKGSYDSLKGIYKFNDIIKDCIDMTKHKFKSTAGQKGNLELVTDLQSKGLVYVNEYEVKQSIINIILNGVDAMDGDGQMIIRTYDVGSQAVLEISDTGKGMDEQTKAMIFNPFFTTKGNEGTGLGLNIAKKVFDNHRAKVFIDSKLGQGCKFTIFFPMEENIYNVAEVKDREYNIN